MEDRSLSGDELDAVESNFGRVVEVVYNDDLIAMLDESESSEGSDVSCTTIYLESQLLILGHLEKWRGFTGKIPYA